MFTVTTPERKDTIPKWYRAGMLNDTKAYKLWHSRCQNLSIATIRESRANYDGLDRSNHSRGFP